MRSLFMSAALGVLLPAVLSPASAQGTAAFKCLAPAGHVCQFQVQTSAGAINFALPSGERKEVSGVTPHADKYCVCDPGPVTPDCKAPRLDHWCMGSWLDVDTGLNSESDMSKTLFADE